MKSKKQFIFTPPLFTNNYTTKPSLKRGKYKMNILVLEDNLYDKTALLTLIKAWQNEAKHEVFIIAKESIEGDERSLQQFLNIDAAILDIETPGIDGLSFAKYLRKYNSRIDIAFISSHTEFLTSGFDVYACTFIEKPIPKEKIYSLLNYLWTRSIANENKEYVLLKRGTNQLDKYYSSDIIYIEASMHGIEVHTYNKKQRYNMSLNDAMKLLPPKTFCRCQKGILVNINKIKGLTGKNGQEIILITDEKIKAGKSYINGLKQILISSLSTS